MRSMRRETQAARDAWKLALVEYRVVRFHDDGDEAPGRLVSYPTTGRAAMALAEAREAGIKAEVVVLP